MANAKKLPSGSWRVNLYVGKDAAGKRQYKSFTDPDKRTAEYQAADYALTRQEKAKPLSITVGEAIDKYIDTKTFVLSPSTIANYRKIRKNNMSSLMGIKLFDLAKDDVQIAVNTEAATHSPKTVRNQHGLLAAALSQYHPSFQLTTKLPQKVRSCIVIPEQQMITDLISMVRGTYMELSIALAACMGLRRSEICALTWSDYNTKKQMLSITKATVLNDQNLWVVKSTKSYAGTRILNVPAAVAALLDNADHTQETIVNANPAQVTQRFFHLKGKLGAPIRFHDLRHYYASVLLALGVPDKYAMERMGHATTNMLKTVYQHTMQDKQKAFTDQINTYLNGVMQHDMQHDLDNTQ